MHVTALALGWKHVLACADSFTIIISFFTAVFNSKPWWENNDNDTDAANTTNTTTNTTITRATATATTTTTTTTTAAAATATATTTATTTTTTTTTTTPAAAAAAATTKKKHNTSSNSNNNNTSSNSNNNNNSSNNSNNNNNSSSSNSSNNNNNKRRTRRIFEDKKERKPQPQQPPLSMPKAKDLLWFSSHRRLGWQCLLHDRQILALLQISISTPRWAPCVIRCNTFLGVKCIMDQWPLGRNHLASCFSWTTQQIKEQRSPLCIYKCTLMYRHKRTYIYICIESWLLINTCIFYPQICATCQERSAASERHPRDRPGCSALPGWCLANERGHVGWPNGTKTE